MANKENEKENQVEEHVIENEFENAPDEGREDVPTEDKILRDTETGKETFIKNDNKTWKIKKDS